MTLKPPLMSSMCEWQKALLLEIAPFVYPGDLDLKTWVNGELRQSANTSDLIFNCDQII